MNTITDDNNIMNILKTICTTILLFTTILSHAKLDSWTERKSKLNKKFWAHKTIKKTYLALRSKEVSNKFKFKKYQNKYEQKKKKFSHFVGANKWSVSKREMRKNSLTLMGSYIDNHKKKVYFLEHSQLQGKKLITFLLTQTDPKNMQFIEDQMQKIKLIVNEAK